MKPDFRNMSNSLKKIKDVRVDESKIIEVEQQVLVQLGFDFNFVVEPLDILFGYLHYLGYSKDKVVRDTAINLLILKLFD